MADLVVGLGIALVLEGALMALLPDSMRRRFAAVLSQPSAALRGGGVVAAALGVFLVWLVRGS
jgi:uncharacterized protein YjeT (DUF2065 family)